MARRLVFLSTKDVEGCEPSESAPADNENNIIEAEEGRGARAIVACFLDAREGANEDGGGGEGVEEGGVAGHPFSAVRVGVVGFGPFDDVGEGEIDAV